MIRYLLFLLAGFSRALRLYRTTDLKFQPSGESGVFTAQAVSSTNAQDIQTWTAVLKDGVDPSAFCDTVNAVPRDLSCTYALKRVLRGVLLEGPVEAIKAYLEPIEDQVKYVEESAIIRHTQTDPGPPASGVSFSNGAGSSGSESTDISRADGGRWGIDRIDQATGRDGFYNWDLSGLGVNIYIIDTYVNENHIDFKATPSAATATRATSENPGNLDTDPSQCTSSSATSHGTHVAGIAGGLYSGVAKGANITSVQGLSCVGSASSDKVILALDWILTNGNLPGVISMSLGSSNRLTSLGEAIKSATDEGFPVVVAAGNDGIPSCFTTPSFVAEAISVGASTITDGVASFSNYGDCTQIYAPGVSIWSASTFNINSFVNMMGTSMAAPVVSGALALYLQGRPKATPTLARYALLQAARQLGSTGNKLVYVPPLQKTLISVLPLSLTIPQDIIYNPTSNYAQYTFSIALSRNPGIATVVTVSLTDSAGASASYRGNLSPTTLTFDSSNFATPQTVTLTISDTVNPAKIGENIYLAFVSGAEVAYAEVIDQRVYGSTAGMSITNPVIIDSLPFLFTFDTSNFIDQTDTPVTFTCKFRDEAPIRPNIAPGVWFMYKPTTAVTINVTMCDSYFDTLLMLAWKTGANSWSTVCNNDYVSFSTNGVTSLSEIDLYTCDLNYQSSRVAVKLTAGIEYYLLVTSAVAGMSGKVNLVYSFVGDNTDYSVKIPTANDAVDDGTHLLNPDNPLTLIRNLSVRTSIIIIVVIAVVFCLTVVSCMYGYMRHRIAKKRRRKQVPVTMANYVSAPGVAGSAPSAYGPLGAGPSSTIPPWTCQLCGSVNHPSNTTNCFACGAFKPAGGANAPSQYAVPITAAAGADEYGNGGYGNGVSAYVQPSAPSYAPPTSSAPSRTAPKPSGPSRTGPTVPGGPVNSHFTEQTHLPPHPYGLANGLSDVSSVAHPIDQDPAAPTNLGTAWNCPRCTLRNTPISLYCEACRHYRWSPY